MDLPFDVHNPEACGLHLIFEEAGKIVVGIMKIKHKEDSTFNEKLS